MEKSVPKTSSAKAYVIGQRAFAAITAVEGLKLSRSSEERLKGNAALPPAERRAATLRAFSGSRTRSKLMYDAFDDPYAYSGSTVLQNLLDIRDPIQLEAFEVEISTLRAEEPLPAGNFDAQHYCRIHHHLFQDVYAWAGKYRTVRTSKGGNSFCYPEYIEQEMNSLCDRFQNGQKFANCERATFATLVAKFLGELMQSIPFVKAMGVPSWPSSASSDRPSAIHSTSSVWRKIPF